MDPLRTEHGWCHWCYCWSFCCCHSFTDCYTSNQINTIDGNLNDAKQRLKLKQIEIRLDGCFLHCSPIQFLCINFIYNDYFTLRRSTEYKLFKSIQWRRKEKLSANLLCCCCFFCKRKLIPDATHTSCVLYVRCTISKFSVK